MNLTELISGIEDNYSFDYETKIKVKKYLLGEITYEEIGLNDEHYLRDNYLVDLIEKIKKVKENKDQSIELNILKRGIKLYFSILHPHYYEDIFRKINIEDLLNIYPEFHEEVLSEDKIIYEIFNDEARYDLKDGIKALVNKLSLEKVEDFLINNSCLKTRGHYNYENNLICFFMRNEINKSYKDKNYHEVKKLVFRYLTYLTDDYLCSDEYIRDGEIEGDKYRNSLSTEEKKAFFELLDSGENWDENINILRDNLKYVERGQHLRNIIALFEIDLDFKNIFWILKSMKIRDEELFFIKRFFKIVLDVAPDFYVQSFHFQGVKSSCHWKNADIIVEKFEDEVNSYGDLKELLSDYIVTYTVEHLDCAPVVHKKVIEKLFEKYGFDFMLKHFKPKGLRDKVCGIYEICKHVKNEIDRPLAEKLKNEIYLDVLNDLREAICIDEKAGKTFIDYIMGNVETLSPKKVLKKKIEHTGNFAEYYIFEAEMLRRFTNIILESKNKELIHFLINDFHKRAVSFPHEEILKMVIERGSSSKEFLKEYVSMSDKISYYDEEYYYRGNDYKDNIFHKGLKYLEDNDYECLQLGEKFSAKLKKEMLDGIYSEGKVLKEAETLVEYLGDKQKGVVDTALKHLKNLDEQVIKRVEDKIYTEISTYVKDMEAMAVEVLCEYNSDQEKLRDLYNKVSEPKSRDKIAQALELEVDEIYQDQNGLFDLDAYLDKVYKSEKKFPIDLEKLAKVVRKDGKDSERAIKQFVITYKNSDELAINREAIKISECFTENSLKEFAKDIFDYWIANGMNVKDKWQLLIPIIHGDYTMIQDMVKLIEELASNSRQKLSVYLIKSLGLNGTKDAFIAIDKIGRRTKLKTIKMASEEAFEIAANELGISKGELGDSLVENMGLEKGYILLEYSSQKLKLYVGQDLHFVIEKEDGKKVKSLPKIGKDEDPNLFEEAKEKFKLLKKGLKDISTLQINRMEDALVEWRLWEVSKWENLFLNNQIMNIIGQKILWGVYKENKLITTFILKDTLYGIDGESVTLSKDDSIGIVHVLELSKEDIDLWKEKNEFLFEQLDREVMVHDGLTGEEYTPDDYPRKNPATLVNRLRKKGWNIGSVRDGGSFNELYKEIRLLNLGVELTLKEDPYMGSYGYETDSDDSLVGLLKVEFYRLGKIKRGSYEYDELEEHKGLRYSIETLEKRIVSELLLEIKKGLS